jgi:hypothetical protein
MKQLRDYVKDFSRALKDKLVYHFWEKHLYHGEVEWKDNWTSEERVEFLDTLEKNIPLVKRACGCNLYS